MRATLLLERPSVRFLAVGAANTLLTWLFFALLVTWLPHQIALILAYLLGIVVAWLGNSRWVFRSRPGWLQAGVYPLIYLTTWLINAGLLEWMIVVHDIGPRSGQAMALVIVVPISFILNAALLDSRRPNRIGLALTLLPALALTFAFLWPLLGGFWLSDDVPNLYRTSILATSNELWSSTLAFFYSPVDAVGNFYRPAMMTSIVVLFLAFGDWYPGWAAASLLMHLANLCLIALLIRSLLAWSDFGTCHVDPARVPTGMPIAVPIAVPITVPALAALLFGLNPLIMEGVAWVSARSDPAVTLFSLAAAWFWAGRPGSNHRWSPWALPLLLIPALGFKESAVILPLQILCLAMVWPEPLGRHRLGALVLSGLIAAAFMGLRVLILHNPQVVSPASGDTGVLTSLPAWWSSLFSGNELLALGWLVCLVLLIVVTLAVCRGPHIKLALGLVAAGAGLALATLLNVGGLEHSGEGGRLAYGPVAWMITGLGLGLAALPRPMPQQRMVAASLALAVFLGAILTTQQVGSYRAVQDSVRGLVAAVPEHVNQHQGLTLLLVPDTVGFVVAFRNAQGGIVMPPLQEQPLLHRMLPTLPDELDDRQQQLAAGLATQLAQLPPAKLDDDALARLFEPAEPGVPDHIACWDARERRLIVLPSPSSDWRSAASAALVTCSL
jgi:putative flippase GtrA